ncbi:hypothetical protein RRG08_062154 [Elysia crispata]|uniref:Guanylate cyclase domain-containing protein n=1 Tax=Elysia crispata TaxID=231223 RepID=A0AAE1DNW9_9GAST|nr:hypothetical protein RRG08_062154 [Elysia crispata]
MTPQWGICRGEPLTDTGKRIQLLKILSLTLLPILGLWAFTVYSLSYSIQGKSDIEQEGVTSTGTNLTAVIQSFRHEMQNTRSTHASITRGQYWFDNMTLYLDTLLIIQQDLANLINEELQMCTDYPANDILILLNNIFTAIDSHLENHDVYKVETINDGYMVASGLPIRRGNRHSADIANFALTVTKMIRSGGFRFPGDVKVRLRIGINTVKLYCTEFFS